MNNWVPLLLILVLACSCQRRDQSYPMVEVPVPNTDFYEAGLAEVERRVQNSPGNADAHLKKALYLEALGNSKAALSAINQAIALDPTPDYLLKQAQLHMVMGAYQQALNSASRAQLLGGDYPDMWHLLASLNYLQANYDAALSQVQKALQKHPKGIHYNLVKGQIHWALNDTLEAQASLIKATESQEVRYEALKQLVTINRVMGDYQKAFQYLLQNRQQQKGDRSLLFIQGQLLRETSQLDSAMAVFRQLQKRDSTDYRLFQERSLIHFEKRRYDSALYYSEKTLALNSNYLPAMLTQARVYDRRNYFSTALKSYEAILAVDSTYAPAVEELKKLNGKIAYLQRVRKSRERNAGLKILQPKPSKDNN